MGLGKTVQVATLLKALFDAEKIKKVLIVVPATMKVYWETELGKWCQDVDNIMQFDDKKKANRTQQIKVLRKHGGVLVTSYGMVTGERINLSEIRFDVVVVDEGHRAKNINTELRRNLVNLRVKGIRLSLSGTPIQNNLSELWSVFDFVQPKIFGNFNNFQLKYTEPIEKGLLKGASRADQLKSDQLSSQLRQMYDSHFLRRTKDNIFTIRCAETLGRELKMTELPLKTDLVIWLPLTQTQKKIY
jgi:SNF2 family DNA or RNA helicase